MKLHSKIQIVLILFLLILFSCENKFEMQESYTVLHGLVFEGQSPKIILAQSLDAFPEYAFNVEYYDQPFSIDDYYLNIEILVTSGDNVFKNFEMRQPVIQNKEPYSSMQPTASSYITYFIDTSFIPEAGKEYTIEIKELPDEGVYQVGFDYLKSNTHIPQYVPVTIEQESNVLNPEFSGSENPVYNYVYTISFDDPSEKNYFYLTFSKVEGLEDFSMDTVNMDQLWQESVQYDFSTLWLTNLRMHDFKIDINPENPVLFNQSVLNGYLLDDDNFNGQKKNIRFELTNYSINQGGTAYVVVELLHISEEYYNYYSVMEKQSNSQKDIFFEPTQLYTNIENGLGVFAGASMSTQSMKIVSKP